MRSKSEVCWITASKSRRSWRHSRLPAHRNGNQFGEAEAITPVLLGGGSGTRLWPLSRELQPKQFVQFNDDRTSFFGATLQRLAGTSFASPIIMCNNKHRFLVREEVERVGATPRAIILEPVSRNTAMAIAVAAAYLHDCDPESIMAVVPSDHRIDDDQRFRNRLIAASKLAAQDKLVLFGVKPTEPHTGYGYIRRGAARRWLQRRRLSCKCLSRKAKPQNR